MRKRSFLKIKKVVTKIDVYRIIYYTSKKVTTFEKNVKGDYYIVKTDLIASLCGKPISYPEICEAAGLQQFTGKQKILQIENLADYCDIQKIPNSSKYIISKIYNEEEKALIQYLKAPQQQLLFDAALYKEFLRNGDSPLYLSNTQMLSIFGEINANFQYTFNRDAMEAVGKEFVYMADMTKEVYEILHQWTRRRLDNMANRFIIMKRRGFRLYPNSIDEIYRIPIDVPSDSQLEKRCQRVMIKAISFIFQNDKYIIRDDATNEVISFHWMPEGLWRKFENKINELTKEEFKEEGYNRLNLVTILSPAPQDMIKEKLLNAESRLEELNEKAQLKILESRSKNLSEFTEEQRKKYIEYNIKKNPPIYFRNKLKEQETEEN